MVLATYVPRFQSVWSFTVNDDPVNAVNVWFRYPVKFTASFSTPSTYIIILLPLSVAVTWCHWLSLKSALPSTYNELFRWNLGAQLLALPINKEYSPCPCRLSFATIPAFREFCVAVALTHTINVIPKLVFTDEFPAMLKLM